MLHIFYFSRIYKMEFPLELQSIINEYAKPASAMLRTDWREGSSIIKILKQDRWWFDYRRGRTWWTRRWTWVDWCKDKMIIGPPRNLSGDELTGLNEEYLSFEDFWRHSLPWCKTWPDSEDHSWCTGQHHTTLPEWVITDYIAETNPALF